MTILSGVYCLSHLGGERVQRFHLKHPTLSQLDLATADLRAWKPGRYLLATRRLYYVGAIEPAEGLKALGRFQIALIAWSLGLQFWRYRWATRLCLKSVLRRDSSYLEDVLSDAFVVDWQENPGRVEPKRLVFADGTTLPRTNDIVRTAKAPTSRIVLYAHHDVDGTLSEADQRSLSFLAESGFGLIVISTSLDVAQFDEIEGLVGGIVRPNVGHDFVSWRLGVEEFAAELETAEVVVLTNNSMEISGTSTIDALNQVRAPFVCLTDSRQVRHHAESVWWQFERRTPVWKHVTEFFRRVEILTGKQAIIKTYEIGFSEFLEQRGFGFTPLWSYEQLVSELKLRKKKFPILYRRQIRQGSLNPSKHLYELLRILGVDILKKTQKLNIA